MNGMLYMQLDSVTVPALTSLGLKSPDANAIHRALSDLARQNGADAAQVRAMFACITRTFHTKQRVAESRCGAVSLAPY